MLSLANFRVCGYKDNAKNRFCQILLRNILQIDGNRLMISSYFFTIIYEITQICPVLASGRGLASTFGGNWESETLCKIVYNYLFLLIMPEFSLKGEEEQLRPLFKSLCNDF